MKKSLFLALFLCCTALACPKDKSSVFAGQAKAEIALQPVCDSGGLQTMNTIKDKTGAQWVEVYRFVTEKDGKVALARALTTANYVLKSKEVDAASSLLTYKGKFSKRTLMILLEKKGGTTFLVAFQ